MERAPSVTVAGCKQLDWHTERRLIDVGLSTSRWAERLTLIDADELDQGRQRRSDTFAVNSAGMLVRRDVWEDLAASTCTAGSGDDVDFCWRNRLAGHRVAVVPGARMFHVSHRRMPGQRVGRAARPRCTCGSSTPPRGRCPCTPPVPCSAASSARPEHCRQDPGHGFSQLLATFGALGRPAAVIRGRRTPPGPAASGVPSSRACRLRGARCGPTAAPDGGTRRGQLRRSPGSHPLADQPTGDSADDFAALTTSERGWVGNGALSPS